MAVSSGSSKMDTPTWPTAITDTHLRLGRRSRRTALAGSRALFVEYRVGVNTYYGVVLRQCEQLLHVYPPPPSVLAIVDTVHHDILNLGWLDYSLEFETVDAKKVVQVMQSDDDIVRLNDQLSQQSGGGHVHGQEQHGGGTGVKHCHDTINLGWEDFESEYETVDAKKVVQVMQSDDEIVRFNDQLSQQSGGGHVHGQEQHGGGTGVKHCHDTDQLHVASTHLVSTQENTPMNVVALSPSPKQIKAIQPNMSTSKQTTLGSFPNFAKHAAKLSEMKPKTESTTTPKKQTTLDSFVTLSDNEPVFIDPKDLERETYEWNGVWYYQYPLFGGGPVGQFDSNGSPITDSDWRPNDLKEEAYRAWYEAYTTKLEHRIRELEREAHGWSDRKEEAYRAWYKAFTTKLEHRNT